MGCQLAGSTLGILGYGEIGRYLADVAKALGMTVLINDPYKQVRDVALRQVPMAELLETSDFVVCLVVANADTENLIDAEAFAAMKPGAFFLNTSRGNLVDEAALAAALSHGKIAGAALDVGRAPDQLPSPELAMLPNVIATPHIGGLTPAATQAQSLETVAQLKSLLAGHIPNGAVNADCAHRLSRFGISTEH
jgi:D-3-phosphoglycerate dehydrogenase